MILKNRIPLIYNLYRISSQWLSLFNNPSSSNQRLRPEELSMSRHPHSPHLHWTQRLMILCIWAALTPACSEPPTRRESSSPLVGTQSRGIAKVTRGGRDFF